MKQKRKLLTLFIAMVMVLTMLPVQTAFAVTTDPVNLLLHSEQDQALYTTNSRGIPCRNRKPSPIGFVLNGVTYPMFPAEEEGYTLYGGEVGKARWRMDHNGYFTIWIEELAPGDGTMPFYFVYANEHTQARFGGLVVAGGGGGGSPESSDSGGGGGSGGETYVQKWAEEHWTAKSIAYGEYYNDANPDGTHSPEGWLVRDCMDPNNTIRIGHGGSGGGGWYLTEDGDGWGNPDGTPGGQGGSSQFMNITVQGGQGGGTSPDAGSYGNGHIDRALTIMRNGNIPDVIEWETTGWSTGQPGGAGSAGEAEDYYFQVFGTGESMTEYTVWGAVNGGTAAGYGNGGGGGGGYKEAIGSYTESGSEKTAVGGNGGGGGARACAGGIVLEGKADLVTIRVRKTTDDYKLRATGNDGGVDTTNRGADDDTTLQGFWFFVTCDEGYIDPFLIETNSQGEGERSGLPLGHYTVTEVTQLDKNRGYMEYLQGPQYAQATFDTIIANGDLYYKDIEDLNATPRLE